MKKILSFDNPFYKKIKKLRKKKYRQEESLYIAEGTKFLGYAVAPRYIVLMENLPLNFEMQKLLDRFTCEKFEFAEKLFNDISSQENSQGVILVYEIKKLELNFFGQKDSEQKNIGLKKDATFDNENFDLIILDKIQDPGNIGTIIRICDSAGFKNIILTEGTVDPYSEKVVRSTMGSLLHVNIFMANVSDIINFVREKKYKIFITALDTKSVPYTKMKLSDKNIFIFGSEGVGVSEELLDLADEKIIIPMYGDAESLNVGVATGIILYKVKEIFENA